jgi:hypothetical protein
MTVAGRHAEDLYAVLGVSPAADRAAIGGAYRRLVKRYHPDVSSDPLAGARIRAINSAHQVLARPEQRAAYDLWRARHTLAPTAVSRGGGQAPAGPHGAPHAPMVRVRPGALHFGGLDRGELATRSLSVTHDDGAVEARVLLHGDWLTVSHRAAHGLALTLEVTADAGRLDLFWSSAGPSVALVSGWLEIVAGSTVLRVSASAVLCREPRASRGRAADRGPPRAT